MNRDDELWRSGDDGQHESLQLDLTYPMMRLFRNNGLSLYLHAQYFTGYGESLLSYYEKGSSIRVGFSLYRGSWKRRLIYRRGRRGRRVKGLN